MKASPTRHEDRLAAERLGDEEARGLLVVEVVGWNWTC
jgi:hypothetical protein